MAGRPDEFSSEEDKKKPLLSRKYSTKKVDESSSEEKKPILSRKYSTKKVDESSSEDRAVSVRLPRNSRERDRMDTINTYLGGDLSNLVNAYEIGDFKGKLNCEIKEPKGESFKTGLFLDDDRIAVVVEKVSKLEEKIYVNTYDSFSGKLITSTLIVDLKLNPGPKGSNKQFNIVITPMRNILIAFRKHNHYYVHYCTQDMEKIWSTFKESLRYHRMIPFPIPILNDDTVIIQTKTGLILRSPNKK
jgi:hypothetical protein